MRPRQVSLALWNNSGQLLWDRIGVPRHVHCGDEAITTAGDGLDKSRASRRIAQHFANLIDRCIQTMVEINEGVGELPRTQQSGFLIQNGFGMTESLSGK